MKYRYPLSEGTESAQRLLGQLHRVDGAQVEHTHMVVGNYEQRSMPIDVAKPDRYEEEGEPVGWTIEAVMLLLSGAGVMALIMFAIWGVSIFRGIV